MKVVINRCFGGFSISEKAARHMAAAGSKQAQAEVARHEAELAAFRAYRDDGVKPTGDERDFRTGMWDISIKYNKVPDFHGYGYGDGFEGGYDRADPLLVAAVEALGAEANGQHASLSVVEIPDGVNWHIDEYDGSEHVAEDHRTWR